MRGAMRLAIRLATCTVCAAWLVACGSSANENAPARASTSPGPQAPEGGYGLGRTPTPAEVAAWSTAIGADGATLPPGRGTVAEGGALYRAQCASCHGAQGQGIAPVYPALVGRDAASDAFRFAEDRALVRTIGNYWPHATTLFDYIQRAMPLLTPGSLTDDQVYAVTAYLLAENNVIPDTATLDAAALRAVRMPARDRFVPDDRPTGH